MQVGYYLYMYVLYIEVSKQASLFNENAIYLFAVFFPRFLSGRDS